LAIRLESATPSPFKDHDVKIVWKGRRIARLIFPSGKVVEFDEAIEVDVESPRDGEPSRGE